MTFRAARLVVSLAALAGFAGAQVKFDQKPATIDIAIDGKPFSTFYYGPDTTKPYLHPLRSADGVIVTRRWPMETVAGESRDHRHHRGLWFGYIDVNGINFWENEASYTTENRGRIKLNRIVSAKDGVIHALFDWRDPAGAVLLTEDRSMAFRGDATQRIIDVDITLTAVKEVVFGDDKDGVFAIRVADEMNEQHTGRIVNSNGAEGMKNTWGKPADWADYSGTVKGKRLGIAIFDHPANRGHPNRWHVRDYGLFAVNPFAQNAFDETLPKKTTTVPPGQSLRYRWRVVIHPGGPKEAGIASLYERYAAGE